jgi:hypothetical protein
MNQFGFDYDAPKISSTPEGVRRQDLIPSAPQSPAQPLGPEGNTLPNVFVSPYAGGMLSGVPAIVQGAK